ncbi:MAG: acyl-CoA/acyl-ACP dehydrogenase [Candidatus Thermoplasmatota archaeon]|jgi:acyl-CoA dehydrogenase|nr:acyl-CoA/acyl-ACP dehydrogenase [Candidatus Thermoplasmatota archaeon]MCL5799789.1 acyl-CoA/acyl-ACP dehydrogenase [Candidatus Thermoplasmatota archaeon]
MDFNFEEKYEKYRATVRDFANREFTRELIETCDSGEKYPEELRIKTFNAGIMDFTDPWKVLIGIEEMCSVDESLGIAATTPYFGAEVLMLFGSDYLKEKYLSKVSQGKAIMGLAVTEPGGGSDVAGLATTATPADSGYMLNGSKMFITNGTIANYFVLLARTSVEEKKHHGLSCFLVDSSWEGFKSSKIKGKMGVRATDTAELQFSNVKIPKENLIGEEGKGFYYIMTFFNISRIYVAAQGLGVARGAINRAMEIVKAKGQAYSSQESVQFAISEMATRLEAARLLTYKAATFLFNFNPNPTLTSMAKYYAAETAVYCTEKALEITGTDGLNSQLERFLRDAKILEIWEGTSEIEKLVVARNLLKEGSVN